MLHFHISSWWFFCVKRTQKHASKEYQKESFEKIVCSFINLKPSHQFSAYQNFRKSTDRKLAIWKTWVTIITIGYGNFSETYVNLEKEIANVSKLYACNNSTWYFNVVLFKNLIHVFPVDQCVIEVSRENKCNVPSIFKVNNRDSRVMTLMPFWCLYFYISNFEHKNKNIISPYMETRMELLCFIIKIFFINFL